MEGLRCSACTPKAWVREYVGPLYSYLTSTGRKKLTFKFWNELRLLLLSFLVWKGKNRLLKRIFYSKVLLNEFCLMSVTNSFCIKISKHLRNAAVFFRVAMVWLDSNDPPGNILSCLFREKVKPLATSPLGELWVFLLKSTILSAMIIFVPPPPTWEDSHSKRTRVFIVPKRAKRSNLVHLRIFSLKTSPARGGFCYTFQGIAAEILW